MMKKMTRGTNMKKKPNNECKCHYRATCGLNPDEHCDHCSLNPKYKRYFYSCTLEKGCEYYFDDGKKKHMMYHDKKCGIYDHSWTLVADSYNKKYYECEWCDAEMQHPKANL